MKHTTRNLFIALLASTTIYGCSKSNDYTTTDHTTGIVKMRSWSGTTSGDVKTDTVLLPDTSHVGWATAFSRAVSDTSFSVMEVNGFQVSVFGATFNYFTTDSVNKLIRFDTTLSGSAMSIVAYYYSRDSVTYEFHQITGYSSANAQYYQVNTFLHTN